jgi:hypothetical protein
MLWYIVFNVFLRWRLRMKLTIEVSDELMNRVDFALGIVEMSREDALLEALSTWVSHMPTVRSEDIDWDAFPKRDPGFEVIDLFPRDYCTECNRPLPGRER